MSELITKYRVDAGVFSSKDKVDELKGKVGKEFRVPDGTLNGRGYRRYDLGEVFDTPGEAIEAFTNKRRAEVESARKRLEYAEGQLAKAIRDLRGDQS